MLLTLGARLRRLTPVREMIIGESNMEIRHCENKSETAWAPGFKSPSSVHSSSNFEA